MNGIEVDTIIYDEAADYDPCEDCCPCCHPCGPDCPDWIEDDE